MNGKLIFLALGCSALTVALVAVPGSSARKRDPGIAQVSSQGLDQDAAEQMAQLQQELGNLRQLHVNGPEGDDVELFLHSGGSWLGARISEVTADKVKELRLPAERGVVLGKIVPDSPAAKAGLKETDVVTEINGQRVEGTEQFRRMIREIPAGRVAQLTVWREGRAQKVDVTLGNSEMHHSNTMVAAPAMPGSFAIQLPEMPQVFGDGFGTMSRTRLGIDAEDVNGEFGNYFGAPDGEGILVRGVFPDTPAAKAGVKVGDIITSVDGERIRSVGELRAKIAEKHDESSIKLGLVRNKAATTLSVELPAPAEKKSIRNGERTNI